MNMLVITPAPKATESLLGYLLRVSEENGYETPWHVMAHAGLSRNKIGAGFSSEKLAAILGLEASALDAISYCKSLDDEKLEFKLLGQSLGRSLKSAPLRLAKPQFCPHCVQEKGFLDAFWDLTFVVACPEHGCTLVDTCPGCGEKLTWFRLGILTCNCGANLSGAPVNNVDGGLIDIMAILKAKIHGNSLDTIDNSSKFPIADLENMPLGSLLVAFELLGRHNLISHEQLCKEPMNIMQGAVETLRNWPVGYHDSLRRLSKQRGQSNSLEYSRLSKRFKELYGPLFITRKRLGLEFLKKEFIRFAMEEWDGGVVSRKLRGDLGNNRFISQTELAVRLGVRTTTLMSWRKKGIVSMKAFFVGKQKRYVVDSKSISLPGISEGKMFGIISAASYVGLPTSVLKLLRSSGHYKVQHRPMFLKAFHENDLNAFRDTMLLLGEVLSEMPANSISLGEVMCLRFRNEAGKADFIREVMSKRIKIIGRMGSEPQGLLFQRDRVEDFLRDKRAEAANGTWSISEAAKYLHCQNVVMPKLISEGLLEIVKASTGRRVTEKSVRNFESKFIALVKLAKTAGTNSRKLQDLCSKLNIPMKIVDRGDGIGGQPFVSPKYSQRIIDTLAANSKAKSA